MKSLPKLSNELQIEPLKHKLPYCLDTCQSRWHFGTENGPEWCSACRTLLGSGRAIADDPSRKVAPRRFSKPGRITTNQSWVLKVISTSLFPGKGSLLLTSKGPNELSKAACEQRTKDILYSLSTNAKKCTPLQLCLCLHAIVYYSSYFWIKQSKQTCSFFLAHPGAKRRETNISVTAYCDGYDYIWLYYIWSWLYLEMEPWEVIRTRGGRGGGASTEALVARLPHLPSHYVRCFICVMMQQEDPHQMLVHAFRHFRLQIYEPNSLIFFINYLTTNSMAGKQCTHIISQFWRSGSQYILQCVGGLGSS